MWQHQNHLNRFNINGGNIGGPSVVASSAPLYQQRHHLGSSEKRQFSFAAGPPLPPPPPPRSGTTYAQYRMPYGTTIVPRPPPATAVPTSLTRHRHIAPVHPHHMPIPGPPPPLTHSQATQTNPAASSRFPLQTFSRPIQATVVASASHITARPISAKVINKSASSVPTAPLPHRVKPPLSLSVAPHTQIQCASLVKQHSPALQKHVVHSNNNCSIPPPKRRHMDDMVGVVTASSSSTSTSSSSSPLLSKLSSDTQGYIWDYLSIPEMALTFGVSVAILNIAKVAISRVSLVDFGPDLAANRLYRTDAVCATLSKYSSKHHLKCIKFTFQDTKLVEDLLSKNRNICSVFFDWHTFDRRFLEVMNKENVRVLSIEFCGPMMGFEPLKHFTNLQALSIRMHDESTLDPGFLANAPDLCALELIDSRLAYYALSNLKNPSKLTHLCIAEILEDMPKVVPNLQELVLFEAVDNLKSIKKLDGLKKLKRLVLMRADSRGFDGYEEMIRLLPSLTFVGLNCRTKDAALIYQSQWGNVSPCEIQFVKEVKFEDVCQRAGVSLL